MGGVVLRMPEFKSKKRVRAAVLECNVVAVHMAFASDGAHDADCAGIAFSNGADDRDPVACIEPPVDQPVLHPALL